MGKAINKLGGGFKNRKRSAQELYVRVQLWRAGELGQLPPNEVLHLKRWAEKLDKALASISVD